MSADRTVFREQLQAALATELGIEFVGGPIDGPISDRNAGCVWWESKTPFARDFNIEQNTFRVRVFRLWKQDDGVTTQQNVVPLEDDAEALELALQAVLTQIGPTDRTNYFNVNSVTADYGRQYVEAVLLWFTDNRSAAGG